MCIHIDQYDCFFRFSSFNTCELHMKHMQRETLRRAGTCMHVRISCKCTMTMTRKAEQYRRCNKVFSSSRLYFVHSLETASTLLSLSLSVSRCNSITRHSNTGMERKKSKCTCNAHTRETIDVSGVHLFTSRAPCVCNHQSIRLTYKAGIFLSHNKQTPCSGDDEMREKETI